jgi:predicted RNase H-like HicB family nuclease
LTFGRCHIYTRLQIGIGSDRIIDNEVLAFRMTEIIFEVRQDEIDGGYTASALGVGIHTEAETLEELRANVKEAVDCYYDENLTGPKIIRLHFVREEVLAR